MRRTIAILLTNVTGGRTYRHAVELRDAWRKQRCRVLSIFVVGRVTRVHIYEQDRLVKTNLFFADEDCEKLTSLLRCYQVDILHVEHLLDADKSFFHLQEKATCSLVVTLHDYYAICPFIQLIDSTGEYCGEKGTASCAVCLKHAHYFSPTMGKELTDIFEWRAFWQKYLQKASQVFVPSADMER